MSINIVDEPNQIVISEDESLQDVVFLPTDKRESKTPEDESNEKSKNSTKLSQDEADKNSSNFLVLKSIKSKKLQDETKMILNTKNSTDESQQVNDERSFNFLELPDSEETFYSSSSPKETEVQKTFEDPMVLINTPRKCPIAQDGKVLFVPLLTSTQNIGAVEGTQTETPYLEPSKCFGSLFVNFNTPAFEINNLIEENQQKKNFEDKNADKENIFDTSSLQDVEGEDLINYFSIKRRKPNTSEKNKDAKTSEHIGEKNVINLEKTQSKNTKLIREENTNSNNLNRNQPKNKEAKTNIAFGDDLNDVPIRGRKPNTPKKNKDRKTSEVIGEKKVLNESTNLNNLDRNQPKNKKSTTNKVLKEEIVVNLQEIQSSNITLARKESKNAKNFGGNLSENTHKTKGQTKDKKLSNNIQATKLKQTEDRKRNFEQTENLCGSSFKKEISGNSKIIIKLNPESESGVKEIHYNLNKGDVIEVQPLTEEASASTLNNDFNLIQIEKAFNNIENQLNNFDNNVIPGRSGKNPNEFEYRRVKFKCLNCRHLCLHKIKKRIGKSKHIVVCSCGCRNLIRFNPENQLDSISRVTNLLQ
ncbi:probable cyclin-dependent serine/threonine-protein kinase DDB_G0292550 [Chrysoperla carnea]|uniref:probable cyclin-dependent serine/threonine-protein kinase DDB_G0292550 n=1 Tax=Chrysoperla carnea TaxID=189513 RepID=UPI001D064E42|nr:probable cyclin-dependent serine/threonine-protein kinase DDB_G0292550 [Chrysoperla carnea]